MHLITFTFSKELISFTSFMGFSLEAWLSHETFFKAYNYKVKKSVSPVKVTQNLVTAGVSDQMHVSEATFSEITDFLEVFHR